MKPREEARQQPQQGQSDKQKESQKQQGQPDKQKDSQQQQQSGEGKQYGEGNYKATRDYNAGVQEHMRDHDIEREARDAKPRSASEEKEMEEAERIGRSKSRGEGK